MGHLHPQHLEDGEQILVCNGGNRAQNKPTNRSWFFFPIILPEQPRTLIHSVWIFLMFLHSVLTYSRGKTQAPVKQAGKKSQILYRNNVFFRLIIVNSSRIIVQECFTKPVNIWINLAILLSLERKKKRVYRANIQITKWTTPRAPWWMHRWSALKSFNATVLKGTIQIQKCP